MLNVYFETSSTTELVARFTDEETYMVCLPSLEQLAKQRRMEVTESIEVPIGETNKRIKNDLAKIKAEFEKKV